MGQEIPEKIKDIIAKEARIDLSRLDPDTDIREQANVDSMQFVAIFARLEREFGIELPLKAMGARTLNEFVSAIVEALDSPPA
jgi:acyl carrier protein